MATETLSDVLVKLQYEREQIEAKISVILETSNDQRYLTKLAGELRLVDAKYITVAGGSEPRIYDKPNLAPPDSIMPLPRRT
ncbi:hypothetical protein KBD71_03550 [Candidatus Woesebacteria bacterium]|nr:hypothetical protein [Candidatus Woesebacteria bacterium]